MEPTENKEKKVYSIKAELENDAYMAGLCSVLLENLSIPYDLHHQVKDALDWLYKKEKDAQSQLKVREWFEKQENERIEKMRQQREQKKPK